MANKMNFYLPSSANQMMTITQYEVDRVDESIQGIKHLLNNKTVDVLIKKINPLDFDVGDIKSKKIYSFNHSTFKWTVHREEDYEEEIKWNWQKQNHSY
jgi:hypothetical protein